MSKREITTKTVTDGMKTKYERSIVKFKSSWQLHIFMDGHRIYRGLVSSYSDALEFANRKGREIAFCEELASAQERTVS